MKDEARLLGYLEHILQAMERIQNYTDDIDEATFLQNEMTQDAVIRNLEVIGEASRNIERYYPEFATATPNCRCLPPTRCATPCPMVTSRSKRSPGRPSRMIYPRCRRKQRRSCRQITIQGKTSHVNRLCAGFDA